MRRTVVPSLLVALGLLLATAAPVLAVEVAGGDDGEGWLGELDDRIITFFSLGVLLFFPLVALLLSLLQGALEKRKQRRKATAARRSAGW